MGRVVRNQEPCVKHAIILLKHWRSVNRLPRFKSFVAEMIVLSAARDLRLYSIIELSCLNLFARSLIYLDLRAASAYDPQVLRYGHLGLYDIDEWAARIAGNIDSGKSMRKRLIILNPMTPILDVIRNVRPAKLRRWS